MPDINEQWLISDCLSGILTITAQLLLAIYGIGFNYRYRLSYPLKQNSPLLTIFCLIVLTLEVFILFTARMIIGNDFIRENCFYDIEAIEVLSYLYTFCQQFVLMAYFLKMIRVLAAYLKTLYKIGHIFLKYQFLLLLICFVYSGLIIGIDAILRNAVENQKSSNNLYMFFCVRFINDDFWSFVYVVKVGITYFIYFFAYFMSVKIHSTMNFRSQWRFALLLSIIQSGQHSIFLSFQISPIQTAYYISMLTSVIQTCTIVYYLGTVNQVCPIPSSRDTINDNFETLFGIEQLNKSITFYFQANGSSELIKAYNLCESAKRQQYFYPERQIKKLVKVLKNKNQYRFQIDEIKKNKYNYNCDAYKALVVKITDQCQSIFKKGWFRTKERQYFSQAWEKNAALNERFENLKIDI